MLRAFAETTGQTAKETSAFQSPLCSLAVALLSLLLASLLSTAPSTAFAGNGGNDPDASAELTATTQTFDPLQDPDYVDSDLASTHPAAFGFGLLSLDNDQQLVLDTIRQAVTTYNQVTFTVDGEKQTRYGVKVKDFGMTAEDLNPILQQLWDDPELFYFPSSITFLSSGDEVWFLAYDYLFDSTDQIDQARAQVEENAAQALTWVADDMSPVQKVQAMHDYLVRTCAYGDPNATHSHTAYGALVQRTPVCQGYALAYKMLLSRLGIGCVFVTSDSMIHGWNLVQLDGVWYHVDVTWDDPLVGSSAENAQDQGFDAEVSHRYFLKSDATFQGQLEHFGWVSDVEAPQDYEVYDYPVFNGPADPCWNGHSYGQWSQTAAPTCLAAGSKERTCQTCGKVQAQDVGALGHSWEDLPTVDVEPTCTEAGEKSVHCTRCSERKDMAPVPLAEHSYGQWSQTAAPTCLTAGSKERTCQTCGRVQTQDVGALGHAWASEATVDVEPTYDAEGSRSVHCTRCEAVKDVRSISALAKTDLGKCSVRISTTSYTYNGATRKPTVSVKLNGQTLSSDCYTVTYASGRKLVGTYAVTVTAKSGNVPVCGSAKLTFTIVPRTTYVTSLSAAKAGFTVQWSKRVAQTSGYQIQYRMKGLSSTKTITVSGTSTTAKKITKLRAKKRYYVKVRTYKTVSGKRYYSSWSSSKSVVTK